MKLTSSMIVWLDNNHADEYKILTVVPVGSTEEQRVSLMSKSPLTVFRRRHLIDIFNEEFELDIEESIQLIGRWQNYTRMRGG